MAGTENLDARRLPGRTRRHSRHPAADHAGHDGYDAAAADAEAEADQEIEAVTRLMGFLRQDGDEQL